MTNIFDKFNVMKLNINFEVLLSVKNDLHLGFCCLNLRFSRYLKFLLQVTFCKLTMTVISGNYNIPEDENIDCNKDIYCLGVYDHNDFVKSKWTG